MTIHQGSVMRALVLLVGFGAAAAAQTPPAVRLIAAPDATSPRSFGGPAAVRQLPDGRLLVNDTQRRQLLVADASLANVTVLADSGTSTARSYGARAGGIIPYLADSTLFVDPAGLSMFVISPSGAIARVASVPRSQDAAALANNTATFAGLDAHGRLVYRGLTRVKQVVNGGLTTAVFPDSIDIDRLDVATRHVDTVGYFKVNTTKMVITQTEHGMTITGEVNPMQTIDDWAVLADGSVAIVRGQDYHVDLVRPDGSVAQAPKIPFEWVALTDEMKQAVLDSAKAQFKRAMEGGPLPPQMLELHGGGGNPMSMHAPDGAPRGGQPATPPMTLVGIDQLPDYRPAFTTGAARADVDGNLWVRTSATRAGAVAGPIYDVIDRDGRLVDRVQLQPGRQVVGFGPHGVVYLAARDDRGAWLERTKR
jgi:hypothetical protein